MPDRDPRFTHGGWLAPAIVMGLLCWAVAILIAVWLFPSETASDPDPGAELIRLGWARPCAG